MLKVAANSKPGAVAGAIANVIRERRRAEIQVVGAGAVNQAIKAIAIARTFLKESGIEIVFIPAFVDVRINGQERTAIRLIIEAV